MGAVIMNFPLSELPYDAFVRLANYPRYLKPFEPTNPEEDLRTGKINRLIYWYPVYVSTLYALAEKGVHYKDYLDNLHGSNYWHFVDLFRNTAKLLDTLLEKSLNKNNLDEIKIKNKKVKLERKK